MIRRMSISASTCAAAAALFIVACRSASGPDARFPDLSGRWTTQDTVRYAYAWAADGSSAVNVSINQLELTFIGTSDSTYNFQWTGGFKYVYDSLAGQLTNSTIIVSTGPQLRYDALVRGDTAFLQLLGAMPLDQATPSRIVSHPTMRSSDCLQMLGTYARPSPPPLCQTAFHWTRVP